MSFVDIAPRAGLIEPVIYGGVEQKRYIIETNGCGVAFFDYDNDGWSDILLLTGTRLEGFPKGKEPTNRLYRNNRNGTFTEVTEKAGLRRGGWASSVCAGDYDNDGNEDLFITYWGQNVLYRNNGDATFTDVTRKAGLAAGGTRWGSGCTFVDYDRDGKLDLFVANYLKFDLGLRARTRQGRELQLERRAGELRAEGSADGHEPALSKQRRRHLRRCLRSLRRRQSAGPLFDDFHHDGFQQRRLARHLRRLRFDGQHALPQQQGRHLHGRCARSGLRL